MTQLIPIFVVAAIAWFWWDSSRAREAAVSAARRACQNCDVQFLDQTVALRDLRVARNSNGRFCLLRRYVFEFSQDGSERDRGYAIMLGQRLAEMHLNLLVDPLVTKH